MSREAELMHQPYWIISKALRIIQRRSLHLIRLRLHSASSKFPRMEFMPR